MSNVIVLDSSDEEDPPAKKIKINNMPPAKQKLQTISRQIIQQQQQHQPLKKVQNSIQITPIYNNNNNNNMTINNSPKTNQNIVNTGLRNNLDKKNSITINSVTGGVTINKTPQTTIQLPANKSELINNNISITRTDLLINNELNTLKTTPVKKLPMQITNNTIPINLPNLIKNSVTVKRINSPVSQKNSSPKSISPTTIGITKKSVNIQQRKKDGIDPLKIPQMNKLNQQQQKNVSINNNINNNNNNNKEITTPVNKIPLKRKLSEKTSFEKNLEQQIAQRQQKAPPPQQSPPIKRIKPITISNKIDSKNWLNNHSPVITIDDDDDDDDDIINIKSSNLLQSSPKPFSVKLNNSYIQNIYSPLELVTATITEPTSPIYPKTTATITTKSITHTITSPIEISTNNNDIDKTDDSTIKNSELPHASSASTTPNSKIQDDNIDNDIVEKNPMTPVYEELLKQCRLADPSNDMEKLIEKKLLKYYHCVHPDFVTSKGFRKTCELTIAEIKNTPELVYLKIKTIVEELKTRKNSKQTIVNNEEHTTTGNAVRDDQVKKLSRGLYKLQMIIKKLEEDDVDWNNDSNSPYLKVERYKKRACEIYEKICDLTGESKHAHRLVSKPISFQGTSYPPFNKTIQTFVNRTKSFPDYLDVYRLLEFCNKQNSWDMSPLEMKAIAQDAFVKIGKLLQKRRQTDLYETVIHFTGDAIDPAENDTELNAKLNENQKHITKISTILEKFSKQQDFEAAEKQKTKDEKNNENNEDENNEKSDDNDENENIKLNVLDETTSTIRKTTITSTTAATTTTKSISLSENYLNDDTIINNNNKLNSIQNPLPSTSKCSSEIKIHSVASLRKVNNNNNNHNIVGEIVLSDDDDET